MLKFEGVGPMLEGGGCPHLDGNPDFEIAAPKLEIIHSPQ